MENKIHKQGFVYRFLNKDGTVIYVGKTINLKQRFSQHEHLTEDVKKIEYISCDLLADMAWKEIYYINLFYNKLSTNVSDVYEGGVTDLKINDIWKEYKIEDIKNDYNNDEIIELYNKYVIDVPKYDYKKMIHIVNHNKLNKIGDDTYALSRKWFDINKNNGIVNKLQKNVYNFFHNVAKASVKENLWTTYDEFEDDIKGKGYAKGFSPIYNYDFYDRNKINLAFVANIFLPAMINKKNFVITEDQYSLMILMQFIWKSALRDGKEITIYIPSKRMRELLQTWIKETGGD